MTPAEKTRLLAELVHWDGARCFEPLTNLSHAGEVLEAMRAKGWLIHILIQPDTNVVHLMEVKGPGHLATDDEALPTAICHAALLAHEVKEEEL